VTTPSRPKRAGKTTNDSRFCRGLPGGGPTMAWFRGIGLDRAVERRQGLTPQVGVMASHMSGGIPGHVRAGWETCACGGPRSTGGPHPGSNQAMLLDTAGFSGRHCVPRSGGVGRAPAQLSGSHLGRPRGDRAATELVVLDGAPTAGLDRQGGGGWHLGTQSAGPCARPGAAVQLDSAKQWDEGPKGWRKTRFQPWSTRGQVVARARPADLTGKPRGAAGGVPGRAGAGTPTGYGPGPCRRAQRGPQWEVPRPGHLQSWRCTTGGPATSSAPVNRLVRRAKRRGPRPAHTRAAPWRTCFLGAGPEKGDSIVRGSLCQPGGGRPPGFGRLRSRVAAQAGAGQIRGARSERAPTAPPA